MTREEATRTRTMSAHKLSCEIQRRARFVTDPYLFAMLIMTFQRNAPIQFVKAGGGGAFLGA